MSASFTSQSFFAAKSNLTLNEKGADAFKSTTNPILDLFTETRKKVPDTLDEFNVLVRKIEAAKNFDSEMFVRLLKFHRLIEKGNGMKGIYYICMMILKEEDHVLYEQIINWSHEYPKDILRLARLSSMFGENTSKPSSTTNVYGDYPHVTLSTTTHYTTSTGTPKGTLGKKMTKWLLTEQKSGNVSHIGTKMSPKQTVAISAEIELYAQLVVETIKKILTGKFYDADVNPMLFKYLSYETGHFAVESKIIWTRIQDLMAIDPVIIAAFGEYSASTSV
jgi:hypothetical protein